MTLFRKGSGYALYPLLALCLIVPSSARAQSANSQQQQTAPQTPPVLMQEPPSKNEQQRALILREAQSRVNARRQARIRQIIQETYSHQYEVYFGGGYLRFRPGATLQHMNEYVWNVGGVDYFHGRLGVAADARGDYGTAYTGRHAFEAAYEPSISQYTLLAGPQYRFFEGQHWGWTAQALAGVGHGNFATGTGGLGSAPVGLYNDGTVLDISPGVSVDYNLGTSLALRLTPNALFTDYSSTTLAANGTTQSTSRAFQRDMGFNVGILYRFGHQH